MMSMTASSASLSEQLSIQEETYRSRLLRYIDLSAEHQTQSESEPSKDEDVQKEKSSLTQNVSEESGRADALPHEKGADDASYSAEIEKMRQDVTTELMESFKSKERELSASLDEYVDECCAYWLTLLDIGARITSSCVRTDCCTRNFDSFDTRLRIWY